MRPHTFAKKTKLQLCSFYDHYHASNIQRSYVNSILSANRLALQQQQQRTMMMASQKDSVPEEQLAMIPTPRNLMADNTPLSAEARAKEQAQANAIQYAAACVANDRTPISLVMRQTEALSTTLDLNK